MHLLTKRTIDSERRRSSGKSTTAPAMRSAQTNRHDHEWYGLSKHEEAYMILFIVDMNHLNHVASTITPFY